MTTTTPRAAHGSAATAAPAGAPRRRRRPTLAPYVLSAPAVLLYVAFLAVPIAYAVYLSFRGLRLTGGGAFGRRREVWVGADNYVAALTDPELGAGLLRLLVYGAIAVPLTLGLALLFALLLDMRGARLVRFSRTAIFLPYAVPGVIATLLWGFMYLPSTSPFSWVTRRLADVTIPFLDVPLLYPSLANIAIWGGVGFNMIILYTSLRGIPDEISESARLDGASEWQIALRIKVPLVGPALVLTGLFALIGTLQVYGEPATLKPMTSAISWTFVPLMKIYRDAFLRDDLPLAAASSVVLALGTLVVSIALLRLGQRRVFGEQS
ncbi:carbohydrate ABC transporter permease [Cellulomonas endophytica]|uniref:carbohydrate ABC transporter permease n=1 Tax=Cellulomonas endophytica TaxID=2494735 RepID=UPI00101328E7|nr:sugar ABC transporter permease [Cellulomonas endophytica]